MVIIYLDIISSKIIENLIFLNSINFNSKKVNDEDNKADICFEIKKFEIFHNENLVNNRKFNIIKLSQIRNNN